MANKFVQDIELLNKVAKQKIQDRKSNSQGFAIRSDMKTNGTAIKVTASAATEEVEETEPKPTTTLPVEPSPTVPTEDQIQAMIQSALTLTVAPLQKEVEEAKQAIATESQEKLQLQQQLDAERQEKEQLKNQLTEAQKAAKALEDLGKLGGKTINSFPAVNKIITSKSDKPEGAIKEFLDIRNRLPSINKPSRILGRYTTVHDNRELDRFVKKNMEALKESAEDWGRANGMFQGTAVTNAATVGADIVGGFLPVLSAIMRQNNRPGFVWWQFPVTRVEFNKGEGDTVRIPRASYQPRARTKNDRLLSGNGTYTRVDSGSQNLSTGTINAVLEEYGLGRNSEFPPIMLASFTAAYSMIDLLAILNRNLGYDYYSWENTTIREMFIPTSRVVYNKRDAVNTSAAALVTGDIGQCTRRYLRALSGYMKELQIPTFMNQKYVLVLPSTNVTQLSQDMDKFWAAPTPDALLALTNVLNPSLIAASETDRITGYVGDIEGFMVFEDNDFGVGAAGSPGVRTQTIAGNSVTTRSAYAFGGDATGRGVGTEMELRFDTETDFGRSSRVIWRSEEAFVPMDVDPVGYNDTSAVPQQLRVIEARFTDTAI